MSRTHLHGEDKALVAVDNAVGILDVLRSLLVAAFESGYVAQPDDLSRGGVGKDNQFREFINVTVWYIHMDDGRAIVVVGLASDGSEAVGGQLGCNHGRRHCILGHTGGVHVDGDFFFLLTHNFDVAHRLDVTKTFRETIGEITQLTRRALVAFDSEE